MTEYSESRLLPFRAADLFEIVADVEAYPSYIKGCKRVKVLSRSDNQLQASVVAGIGPFCETYTCTVYFDPPVSIRVAYGKGPFVHLENVWTFHSCHEAHERISTQVDFYISFLFRAPFYQIMMEAIFKKMVQETIWSFEGEVYRRLRYK
ncbi:MAG: type II toxin-antitoxin system RatA family toxin [Alphaproteobacteria bacterium]|nr:MAG: type II toxin-antitoxin system RatA family toxin [Alphaproteobacteria bacterium]